MTPLISVLFLCIFSFHRSDGAAVPDVCSDNTLDTQQVWKYVSGLSSTIILSNISNGPPDDKKTLIAYTTGEPQTILRSHASAKDLQQGLHIV